MSQYTLAATVNRTFPDTVELTRTALADEGFGVLTEIDIRATLKTKLDVDIPDQIILGACRPELAHQALLADSSIAALLPCNVVVRAIDAETTSVEVFDPDFMASLSDNEALGEVATDARKRLTNMLENLTKKD